MKALTTLISAVAAAAALAATVPAKAAVFADFTPDKGSADYKWINSGAGNTGLNGHFFTISLNNQTTAHGVATHFTFLDPALSLLSFIPATFTLDATETGHAATVNGAGVYSQTNVSGNFSFIYTGATVANFNNSGITLVHNSNLLSGVFGNSVITGSGGSGAENLAVGSGGTATYTSDYENFAKFAANSEEFALNLLSAEPHFGAKPGKAIGTFRANGGGNFSAAAIPEPATWGLMILGFGGIGAMVRNTRRRPVAATA